MHDYLIRLRSKHSDPVKLFTVTDDFARALSIDVGVLARPLIKLCTKDC